MKKYKYQNRSQKSSYSCVPLKKILIEVVTPFKIKTVHARVPVKGISVTTTPPGLRKEF